MKESQGLFFFWSCYAIHSETLSLYYLFCILCIACSCRLFVHYHKCIVCKMKNSGVSNSQIQLVNWRANLQNFLPKVYEKNPMTPIDYHSQEKQCLSKVNINRNCPINDQELSGCKKISILKTFQII